MSKRMGGVLADVSIERERQAEIFPEQEPDRRPFNRYQMLPVIVEEVGEVAKGINEKSVRQIREEAVHAAATLVKLVETIDSGNEDPATLQLDYGLAAIDSRWRKAGPTDRDCGAAISDPGDDGSGWR